ncbi:hypothetical protein [Maritalea sp.]|jgi:hypothetical protein|uniref:hypothetical protein n=1 Tax=Maritalea sp. TaxID=2003361 RepID=UPI0039E451FD
MILGSITVNPRVVRTHRSSYSVAGLRKVKTNRPFFAPSCALGIAACGFLFVFADILYIHEIFWALIISVTATVAASQVGLLEFVSRDLSTKQGDVIWGHYKTLDLYRDQIMPLITAAETGGSHE